MKTANPLKKIIKPFVSPAVFDFWASKLVRNASWETPRATVVARHVEARDTVTLELQPNGHFTGFTPGQHINVVVEVAGVRHTRSYSISSLPDRRGRIAITVRRYEGGLVSTELCQHTRTGDVLEISQAFGEMTVPAGYQSGWLLMAAGSGITPLMSILRQLTADTLHQPVTLLYWARTRADLCFFQELRHLSEREPRFHLHFILTREHELLPEEVQGRPSLALFQSLLEDLAAVRAYACGPAGFVDSVRALVGDRVGYFEAEAFTPVALETSDAGEVQVTLAQSGKVLSLPTDRPLLQALEEAGEAPAYGCRMGICNTCACGKPEGVSEDLLTGEKNDQPASALRLCISAARTDLTLDL